ncbi:hypothetical protein OCS_00935 [Ophiocordyceps sinensis CO18]|uniref:Uncharacterized protein n=1 Tax=Ophiocordyceps sinensis (strain Co18 / CGMCC 3.14243) TaxID=911162 RepID=T5AL79_OPHSC|nr:hypothetical protein OCS_00935 [Ophiocordyceps sinensis CO18]
MSSANPHSEGFVEARLGALNKDGSLTNPHPESYIQARVKAESCLQPLNDAGRGEPTGPPPAGFITGADRKSPATPVSIRHIPIESLPLNVRAVLSAPYMLRRPWHDDDEVEPVDTGDAPGQVVCVTQSSKTPCFSLEWQSIRYDFFYDTASDGLVLCNRSSVPAEARAILDDNSLDDDRVLLGPRAAHVLHPGSWRISVVGDGEKWTDILLFHRRYIVEKSATRDLQAGLKRRNEVQAENAPKCRRKEDGDSGHSVVLLANQIEARGRHNSNQRHGS